ncbi:hypothetical protein [Embleya sp. NPDC059237]|uniref:hypothetical protein n=1 Tax=Embleya sp. NPDC059237 TaxID=3346784 RepID=UPI00369EF9F1
MRNPDVSFLWRLLIESLTTLAADPADQVAWLDEYRVGTDELALDFDHAHRLVPSLVEAGRLDGEVAAELRRIDVLFVGMSGRENAERWAREALLADSGWIEIRASSRRLLVDLLGDWRLPMPVICVVR